MKKFALTAIAALFSTTAIAGVGVMPERPPIGEPGFGAGIVDKLPGFGQGEAGGIDPGFGQGEAGGIDPGFGQGEADKNTVQIQENKNNIASMGQAFEQRVDVVNGYLSQAGSAIKNNSDRITANSQGLTDLGNAFVAQAEHTTKEIARLDGRIDALEEKTDKMKAGIAGAHAVASLTQYHGVGQHHVAVGIGSYDGEAAVAAGYTYAFDDKKTTIRGTFAIDTENELAVGASIGHSW